MAYSIPMYFSDCVTDRGRSRQHDFSESCQQPTSCVPHGIPAGVVMINLLLDLARFTSGQELCIPLGSSEKS